MKILFTGASSFTGSWFVKELAARGHEVVATFLRTEDAYQNIRATRVAQTKQWSTRVWSAPFGSKAFFDVVRSQERWDLLCHHASHVTDYKSPDFDPIRALDLNTKGVPTLLKLLKEKQCNKLLITGSVFEQNEGRGDLPLHAFSPYGLSKGLMAEVFQYYAHVNKMQLGKFVIPNPFGPYEESRFTSFLINSWYEGKTPHVATPAYVRDNIHVSLLAKAYAHFAERLTEQEGIERDHPSGYVESQGDFTKRFAQEMRSRLSLDCSYTLANQTEYSEPKTRHNTEALDTQLLGWDEKHSWDELAHYYHHAFGKQKEHASAS
ncbi:NAD(P)-dependent oxidoreductase [Simkania negevensis]|uniref:UDP-glucose 4-epimerase n=1 Tax=Simkania negevensis TaxID=83561 RepID=A0ABS3ARW9_9BACT|nr:NAD(P)-dependent oxidoreductase [Simkania negevensis]